MSKEKLDAVQLAIDERQYAKNDRMMVRVFIAESRKRGGVDAVDRAFIKGLHRRARKADRLARELEALALETQND